MRPLTVPDAENVILALQDEIRRSDESRYDHRLHGLLLVAQGMTAPEVGRMLGDSPRMVQYWVHRFEEEGLSGLAEGDRPGRPRRLTEVQMRSVESALRRRPDEAGLSGTLWDGKTLSAFLEQKFEVDLGVRQCQRLFRQLGFRLRKPRPMIHHTDPIVQAAHKKNSRH
jgi:transposase